MKIGLIIFSNTGNTYSVAEAIEAMLIKKGYDVEICRISAENMNPNSPGGKRLKDAPDVSPFDVVIFGSPVWAFSLSIVMKQYLDQLGESITGKKIGCYVTEGLPFSWMGGNRAIRQMKKICTSKKATVYADGIVHASSKEMNQQVNKLIEKIQTI